MFSSTSSAFSRRFASRILTKSRSFAQQQQRQQQISISFRRRWLSEKGKASAESEPNKTSSKGWLYSAEFWGGLGALAGWGMGLSGIYDAMNQGPEVISLNMTPVLIVYSSLFVRWAWIVNPRNLALCACHATNVVAQLNQLRRALEYKMANGEEEQVKEMGQKVAVGGACIAGSIVAGPTIRTALTNANLGVISNVAAADAGPFT